MSTMKPVREFAHRIGLRAAVMKTADVLGFDITTRNFYSPMPDWRSQPESTWTVPSELKGVAFDVPAQLAYFQDELVPHMAEYTPPVAPPGGDKTLYHYDNGFYGPLDADVLHAMVRHLKPKTIVELGSGYSSLIIGDAVARNRTDGHPVTHDVYDPFAREDLQPRIRAVAELHRISALDVPLSVFAALEPGDVLFVDTTHTVKLKSDVNFVVLEVLPLLKPGVVVHFHDIFLPWEYPRDWYERLEVYWAEQYLLQAFLCQNERWEVLLGNAAILAAYPAEVKAAIPQLAFKNFPGSFWLRAT